MESAILTVWKILVATTWLVTGPAMTLANLKEPRPMRTLANSGKKRVAEGESDVEGNRPSATPEKVTRTTTRLSIRNLTTQPSSWRSSNFLPKICLICKQLGHIYITDRVLY